MKLLRLPRSKVRLGAPLLRNVYDEETRLLLSRGHVVQSEDQLAALLQRGAFVDAEEARAVEHLNASTVPVSAVVPRLQNLFTLWDESPNEMRKFMGKVPHEPNLAKRVAEFAAWLIELVDKDVDIALYHCVR